MFAHSSRPTHFLDDLSAEQRAAATASPEQPLLILAGAGTGKTATLSSRVAWLIEQGVPAERILLVTFTRRAAREMLQRVRSLLARAAVDSKRPPGVVGGTFHSVAYRLIRRHASSLGLPDRFSVIDPSDLADLIDLIREEQGLATSGRRVARKATLADIYSRTVNAQQPLSAVLAAHYPWCAHELDRIAAVFRAVTERKRQAHALDYDDLLLYWRAAAREPRLGPAIAEGFDHLLVDEYQDVNGLQVDVVRALHERGLGVSVVGDDMQAIFGFRAASSEHILEFPELFASAQVMRLETSYRSTQPLLDVANQLAAQARRGYRRELRSHLGAAATAARPELVLCRDEGDEAEQVVERVLAHYERGVPLRQQAVLMRASHHSDLLELELGRRKIPFVKYGGIRYLETAHVKDFVALIRVVVNEADWVSWFRLLQLLEGVGPATARRLIDRIGERREQTPLAERLAAASELVPEQGRPGWRVLSDGIARALATHQAKTQAELLRRAIAPLILNCYDEGELRFHDVERLADVAAASAGLEQFVHGLVLDPPQSSSDFAGKPKLEEDHLVLSTIHSAKGLEWTGVHILHANDGNIPSDMALSTPDGLEEERRLFYVAVTRPRRALHIYAPLRYYHRPRGADDAHGYGKLSRFLTEQLQALCERTQTDEAAHAGAVVSTGAAPAARIELGLDQLWC